MEIYSNRRICNPQRHRLTVLLKQDKNQQDEYSESQENVGYLHCPLSLAAQCIVIGPVCLFATGRRCLWVGLLLQ